MISLSTGELEQHIISLPQHVLYHLFILFFFSARMTAFGDDKRGCLGFMDLVHFVYYMASHITPAAFLGINLL